MGVSLLKGKPTEPNPPSAFGRGYFSSGSYDTYEKDVLSWVRPVARKIISFLGDVPRPRILDAGCAQGYLLEVLQNRKNCRVRGLEYSPHALAGARSSVSNKIVRGSILDGSLFPSNDFDGIACFDVLEYLNKTQNEIAARNMARWTNDFVFFTNPYRHSVSGSQRTNPDPMRLTAWSQREYVALFRKAGLNYLSKFNCGSGGDILVFRKR